MALLSSALSASPSFEGVQGQGLAGERAIGSAPDVDGPGRVPHGEARLAKRGRRRPPPAPPPATTTAPTESATTAPPSVSPPPAPTAAATDSDSNDDSGTLEGRRSGPSRIEFDDRLIQGQTNKANAIYLFERRASELRSLVRPRQHYHKEIDESVR